ncbi:hypothetical protein TNIN_186341 [Trichonephila inaurata madagascariensis]|uniref:Uncharacterized protein n=1 Tax=Trichonephila inaurata madagascariensis TaxID=2747483 RepID=A0A8X6XEH1_9ARAC|nr:hypothetical protein TNIN_186341 [Trichonephila inaurata madagascariensis]
MKSCNQPTKDIVEGKHFPIKLMVGYPHTLDSNQTRKAHRVSFPYEDRKSARRKWDWSDEGWPRDIPPPSDNGNNLMSLDGSCPVQNINHSPDVPLFASGVCVRVQSMGGYGGM